MSVALLPVLETLTVLLQAATLDAFARKQLSRVSGRTTPVPLAVVALETATFLPASLPRTKTLAIFGVAVGLDTAAVDAAFGRHLLEHVVKFALV
jgi:hypothetical protein